MSNSDWPRDVLGRKGYADFLTAYLLGKVSGSTSYTFALDGGWGTGKSFFVEHWANDLRSSSPPHPVVVFNAWAADFSTDPLISFMSELRTALGKEISDAGLLPEVQAKASHALKTAVRKFRAAAIPTMMYAGKALLAKATGMSADEIWDIAKDAGSGNIDPNTIKTALLSDEGKEKLGGALDVFLESAMEEQKDRAATLQAFRESLRSTLEILTSSGHRSLPLFVFVDELDRCRPSFALSLLEGIKHIFGAGGVCFVVSTHIKELAQAARAVYGTGFAAREYLDRFFDVTCQLPEIPRSKFAELLFVHDGLASKGQILELGFPERPFEDEHPNQSPQELFGWVADVFGLDLRSQQGVFEMARACTSSMGKGTTVFLLWLLVLCAIRHKSKELFEQLADGKAAQTVIDNLWVTLVRNDEPRPFTAMIGDDRGSSPKPQKSSLKQVAHCYYKWSDQLPDTNAIIDSAGKPYPQSVLQSLSKGLLAPTNVHRARLPSPISHYFNLVRTAGYIKA